MESTTAEVLAALVKRFQPAAADDLTAVCQLQITGDADDCWHLVIADRQCRLLPGTAQHPDLAISMSKQDWEELIAGRLDPFSAVLSGQLRIAGDMGLATRLQDLFGL